MGVQPEATFAKNKNGGKSQETESRSVRSYSVQNTPLNPQSRIRHQRIKRKRFVTRKLSCRRKTTNDARDGVVVHASEIGIHILRVTQRYTYARMGCCGRVSPSEWTSRRTYYDVNGFRVRSFGTKTSLVRVPR